MIFVVGLSYRTAPVEFREKLAGADLPGILARLSRRTELREVLFLSTCNRVEVFAEGGARQDAPERIVAAVREELARESMADAAELAAFLYDKFEMEAVRHIFRVASSLESMVVGEPQILGQVKDAYDAAVAAGSAGSTLGRCVERAFLAAKRVRTETALGEGLVSVSSVAVDVARNVFGDLSEHVVLLVGAGEMAEAAAKSLARGGKAVRICNRSHERAEELAKRVGGVCAPWSDLEKELAGADVVVVSTASPTYVVTREMVKRAMRNRNGRTLVFVDIAVPRNVEPTAHAIDNVYVFDIDDLEQQVQAGLSLRQAEMVKAEQIVESEIREFQSWMTGRNVAPAIVALRARTRATFLAEIDRSLGARLRHLSESDRAAMVQMVESAVKKHLHLPIARLKQSASEGRASDMTEALRYLFDLPEVTESSAEDAVATFSSIPPGDDMH